MVSWLTITPDSTPLTSLLKSSSDFTSYIIRVTNTSSAILQNFSLAHSKLANTTCLTNSDIKTSLLLPSFLSLIPQTFTQSSLFPSHMVSTNLTTFFQFHINSIVHSYPPSLTHTPIHLLPHSLTPSPPPALCRRFTQYPNTLISLLYYFNARQKPGLGTHC